MQIDIVSMSIAVERNDPSVMLGLQPALVTGAFLWHLPLAVAHIHHQHSQDNWRDLMCWDCWTFGCNIAWHSGDDVAHSSMIKCLLRAHMCVCLVWVLANTT